MMLACAANFVDAAGAGRRVLLKPGRYSLEAHHATHARIVDLWSGARPSRSQDIYSRFSSPKSAVVHIDGHWLSLSDAQQQGKIAIHLGEAKSKSDWFLKGNDSLFEELTKPATSIPPETAAVSIENLTDKPLSIEIRDFGIAAETEDPAPGFNRHFLANLQGEPDKVVRRRALAAQTLTELGYVRETDSELEVVSGIKRFQNDYFVRLSGSLDEPTCAELAKYDRLDRTNAASLESYLVAQVEKLNGDGFNRYKVRLPGSKPIPAASINEAVGAVAENARGPIVYIETHGLSASEHKLFEWNADVKLSLHSKRLHPLTGPSELLESPRPGDRLDLDTPMETAAGQDGPKFQQTAMITRADETSIPIISIPIIVTARLSEVVQSFIKWLEIKFNASIDSGASILAAVYAARAEVRKEMKITDDELDQNIVISIQGMQLADNDFRRNHTGSLACRRVVDDPRG